MICIDTCETYHTIKLEEDEDGNYIVAGTNYCIEDDNSNCKKYAPNYYTTTNEIICVECKEGYL